MANQFSRIFLAISTAVLIAGPAYAESPTGGGTKGIAEHAVTAKAEKVADPAAKKPAVKKHEVRKTTRHRRPRPPLPWYWHPNRGGCPPCKPNF